MKQIRPYPQVIITHKAAKALAGGHPWVFEGEVIRHNPAPLDGREASNGDVVDVLEENGTWQGAGLLSEESRIRVRIVTRNANDRIDQAFWARKLAWAWEYRKTVMGSRSLAGCEPDTECCRVLFSEADGFPGLVADRYGSILVTQVGTVGMERLRPVIYPLLLETLASSGEDVVAIYERNDAPSREKEGLERYKGWWQGDVRSTAQQGPGDADDAGKVPDPTGIGTDAEADTGKRPGPAIPTSSRIIVHENGIAFDIDLENSQKTGFFLDQKYNRRAVRAIADGRRVLDVFCHVGPFGLNALLGGAKFVRFVDSSQTALDLARENVRLNGVSGPGPKGGESGSGERVAFSCADALEYLHALAESRKMQREEGGPFDLIVLDPPAFAKTRQDVRAASRGYREINREAMRILPRGGYLATCSCSHFMTRDLFMHAVSEAAFEAGVQLRQVEERRQSPDHPIVWGIPETHYLDFFIFQVV